MVDKAWKTRTNEDAIARLTALGLLIEVGAWTVAAFLSWILGELSGSEQLTTVIVISVGAPIACMLLIAPRLMLGSLPGQVALGLTAIGQLLLFVFIAAEIADYGDPHLGFDTGAVAFRFAAAALVVLVLTGCIRALLAAHPDRANRRRIASQLGLIAAVVCLAGGGLAALAGATGIPCAAFSFDGDRWRSADRDRVARSLVRCDELIGKTRGEVREMLGHSRGPAKAQRYGTGWTDDALGSSYRFLIVNYDEDNRVRRAHLTPLITD
jgi:hypothetical protein